MSKEKNVPPDFNKCRLAASGLGLDNLPILLHQRLWSPFLLEVTISSSWGCFSDYPHGGKLCRCGQNRNLTRTVKLVFHRLHATRLSPHSWSHDRTMYFQSTVSCGLTHHASRLEVWGQRNACSKNRRYAYRNHASRSTGSRHILRLCAVCGVRPVKTVLEINIVL